MATETQTATHVPQLTVLHRVASIPLVSDSLATIHATLLNNILTRTPYATAQAIGARAYQASEPIQLRLAPVIERADGLANRAVDAVESRYPYPFKTPTEEIYGRLRRNSEHAVEVANKTLDDKVRSPARNLAENVDLKFSPVVDRFEVVVNKLNAKERENEAPVQDTPASPKSKYQYQRAYQLSLDLKDQLYVYTSEQIKQIQEHNVLVQRATATANSISSIISTSYEAASAKIHQLSDTMVAELHSLQSSAAALPAQAQSSLAGLSERLGPVIGDFKAVLREDAPIADKLGRLRATIEQQVRPLLENASATVSEAVKAVRGKSEAAVTEVKETANGKAKENGAVNGNAL